jgi:hypothetical protein
LAKLTIDNCQAGRAAKSAIPGKVTKKQPKSIFRFGLFLFKTEGLVYGINSLCELYGIAHRAKGISRQAVFFRLRS